VRYFLVYLFIEIFVSYKIGAVIGFFGVFMEVVLSAMIGGMIIRNLNFSLAQNAQKLRLKQMSQEEFISIGMFRFVGGVLLVVPGMFSDLVGILMQFSVIGTIVAKTITTTQNIRYQRDKI